MIDNCLNKLSNHLTFLKYYYSRQRKLMKFESLVVIKIRRVQLHLMHLFAIGLVL